MFNEKSTSYDTTKWYAYINKKQSNKSLPRLVYEFCHSDPQYEP